MELSINILLKTNSLCLRSFDSVDTAEEYNEKPATKYRKHLVDNPLLEIDFKSVDHERKLLRNFLQVITRLD